MRLSRLITATRPRSLRLAAACVLAVTLVTATAGDLFGAACSRQYPRLDDVSTVSAALSPSGDLLIVGLDRRVIEVELPDGSWGALSGPTVEALERLRLEAIRTFDGGLLVRGGAPWQLIELNDQLGIRPGPVYEIVNRDHWTGSGSRVESIWLFEPGAERHLVTCSDVYLGGDDPNKSEAWKTALVRIPLDHPADFEVLHRFDTNGPTALGCRLVLPLIATLGDRSFLLSLDDDPPRIYQSRGNAEATRLNAFPEQFAIVPTLEANPTRKQLPGVYQTLEHATMPVGIFGWEGSLYLLSRSPAQDRGTDWWLTRIDPDADADAGTVRLGTSADHLMVVPGDPYWALVEKGPVKNHFSDQDVTGVVAVPAEEIRSWTPGSMICSFADP